MAQIRIMLPGGPLVRHLAEAISHRATLDMRRGLLCIVYRMPLDRARRHSCGVKTLQLLSLSERAIGPQVVELEIEEGEIEVAVQA